MGGTKKKKESSIENNPDVVIVKKCPYDSAGFWSRVMYFWVFPLFTDGYKKALEVKDLYSHPKDDDPVLAAEKLEEEWNRELSWVKTGKKDKPSLNAAVRRAFGWRYFWCSQGLFWGEILIRLTQPLMVGKVVRYLSQEDDSLPSSVSLTVANFCGYGIVVTSIFFVVTRQHSFTLVQRVGNNVRSALTILVYKKLLRLSKSSFEDSDIGKVLNVLANDLNRLDEIARSLSFLLSAPLMAVYVVVVSYLNLGVACVGGLTVLVLFIPIQALMGRLFNSYRAEATRITDKRVRLMSEIVSAMKLIKVYCWEEPFANLVKDIRTEEIASLKKSYLLKAINAAMSFVTTRLMLFTSFVIYALMGNEMHPEPIFVIMSLFNTIRIPVTKNFPTAVGAGAETLVAMKRIVNILSLEERSTSEVSPNFKEQIHEKLPLGSVSMKNFTAKWTKKLQQTSLNNVTLEISPGEMVIVIGSVGSGKTCLLWSLLNEIHSVSGSCVAPGKVSYCPQESWCFGGTVKENILLGNPYDPLKYNAVIEACGLQRDLQLFPDGDSTFVGEKGYSLSGGQKARLTLARASYHEADVYLLDDPLSAVDPRVATHIFDKCIKGFLKNKTVILVTHQLQFLKKADKIIVMEDGSVDDFGSFDDLSTNSSLFSFFVANMNKKLKEDELRKSSLSREKALSVLSLGKSGEDQDDLTELNEEPAQQQTSDSIDRSEKRISGSLSSKVYWDYFASGGSVTFIAFTIVISVASQFLSHASDLFLSAWTQKKDYSLNHSSNDASIWSEDLIFDDTYKNVMVYTILSLLLFSSTLLRAIICFLLCLRCSIRIHNQVFKRVLRAHLLFFENNPLGRILNRLTRDIGVVDQGIPALIADLNMSIFSIVGILGTSIAVNYWLAIPTFVLTAISIPIRAYYIRTAREIQRLDSITKSPVYGHISTTFDGLVTIRAFDLEQRFLDQFIGRLHDSVSCSFLVIVVSRIMGLLVDSITTIYIFTLVVLLMSLPKGYISGGDAGVILSSSILLIGMFQNCVRATVDFETQMISVERVFEYRKLDSEAPLVIPGKRVENSWPQKGKIAFKGVHLKYAPELPFVLKDISFEVKPKEKIGVVGRTGAGKSSLITVLFRLVEPQGVIEIDGVDIKSLGLHQLRSAVSIIPQDPSLFSGTVRRNLDPFSSYDDERMWKVMEEANLRKAIEKISGLDSILSEGGSNLSVGQRQLLCLARALLKNNKILVLDEATANVDQETDTQIQKTIKERFSDCTVITVAHRLNTVIHMDKVLVMDAGRLVEFDTPYNLLQDKRGSFSEMVKQTGPEFERMLHSMAEEHHLKRLQIINSHEE